MGFKFIIDTYYYGEDGCLYSYTFHFLITNLIDVVAKHYYYRYTTTTKSKS